jgi:hypothetical protein
MRTEAVVFGCPAARGGPDDHHHRAPNDAEWRGSRATYRVVGVATDVRRSLRREAVSEVYIPLAQAPLRDLTLQVRGRTGIPATEVGTAMARTIRTVSAELPQNGAELVRISN